MYMYICLDLCIKIRFRIKPVCIKNMAVLTIKLTYMAMMLMKSSG